MKNENFIEIGVKHIPEMTVAYVRHIGPYKGDSNLFKGLKKYVVGRFKRFNSFP